MFLQLTQQLKVDEAPNSLSLDPRIGKGHIKFENFPNSLQLVHFDFELKDELQLSCVNSADSDYFLLKINLSEQAVEKQVNGQEIDIQKNLPSGILYYPPNTDVVTYSPFNASYNIILVKFHKDFLTTYLQDGEDVFLNLKDTVVYEDLDYKSEELLGKVIRSTNRMRSHADLLAFLSIFFDKLSLKITGLKYVNLHPQDNKQLYLAASLLRSPTANHIPTIEELALTAKMGKTKFKNIFRQVFGKAPKQYHQKIKMEYAKEELLKNQKTLTEIAYELRYTHPSKFTRAFKNYFGFPPSQVR